MSPEGEISERRGIASEAAETTIRDDAPDDLRALAVAECVRPSQGHQTGSRSDNRFADLIDVLLVRRGRD